MHNKAGWKSVIKSQGDLQPSFELGTKEPLVTMGRSLFLAESLRNKDSRNTKPIGPAAHRNAFHLDRARNFVSGPCCPLPCISCSRVGISVGDKQRELEKLMLLCMLDKTRWMCANLPAHTGIDRNIAGPTLGKVHLSSFIKPLEDE